MQPIYFKKGQSVDIPNTTLSGRPIIEGKAKLVEFIGKADYPPYPETWKVRFPGETDTFTRTLIPPQPEHHADSDCTLDAHDTCIVCGVYHGDPCPNCGGRGYHTPECTLKES